MAIRYTVDSTIVGKTLSYPSKRKKKILGKFSLL